MKKWVNAAIEELNIVDTAYGKNYHAVEANANKGKHNNGAGGRLNQPPANDPPAVVTPPSGDILFDSTVTTTDSLS